MLGEVFGFKGNIKYYDERDYLNDRLVVELRGSTIEEAKEDNAPILIEIEDDVIHDDYNIALTIDQTKRLIESLQKALSDLEG